MIKDLIAKAFKLFMDNSMLIIKIGVTTIILGYVLAVLNMDVFLSILLAVIAGYLISKFDSSKGSKND